MTEIWKEALDEAHALVLEHQNHFGSFAGSIKLRATIAAAVQRHIDATAEAERRLNLACHAQTLADRRAEAAEARVREQRATIAGLGTQVTERIMQAHRADASKAELIREVEEWYNDAAGRCEPLQSILDKHRGKP